LLRLVDQEKSKPTFAGIERIIYDHTGEPEQVHMDGSKCHPDQEAGEWSLRTTIWAVDELAWQSSFAEPPTTAATSPRGSGTRPSRWSLSSDFWSLSPVLRER
jgi:hypothetical protein